VGSLPRWKSRSQKESSVEVGTAALRGEGRGLSKQSLNGYAQDKLRFKDYSFLFLNLKTKINSMLFGL